LKEKS